jgi:CheY-like chemotaxis protein
VWAFVLGEDGFAVERRDSALGLATLLRRWRPDVVLLDLGLPYRSGAAVLADLKSDPATAAIPVVVVSAVAGGASGAAMRARRCSTSFSSRPMWVAWASILAT